MIHFVNIGSHRRCKIVNGRPKIVEPIECKKIRGLYLQRGSCFCDRMAVVFALSKHIHKRSEITDWAEQCIRFSHAYPRCYPSSCVGRAVRGHLDFQRLELIGCINVLKSWTQSSTVGLKKMSNASDLGSLTRITLSQFELE